MWCTACIVTAPNLNALDQSRLIFYFVITFCSLGCICEQFSLCCARLLSLPAHSKGVRYQLDPNGFARLFSPFCF